MNRIIMNRIFFKQIKNAKSWLLFGLFMAFSTIWLGCQSEHTDISRCYLPADQKAHTYTYQSLQKDGMPPYRLVVQKQGKLLTTQRFDAVSNRLEQTIVEEIVGNGTLCAKYELVSYDSTGKMYKVAATINKGANTFFPFEVREGGGVFPFEITWVNPLDTLETNIITRNRHFEGFSTQVWQGKTVQCADFLVKTRLRSDHQRDGSIAPETVAVERYAQNIGLIYSSTTYGAQTVIYTLVDRQ